MDDITLQGWLNLEFRYLFIPTNKVWLLFVIIVIEALLINTGCSVGDDTISI